MTASFGPCEWSATSSGSGQRADGLRARSASRSASGVTGIVNGWTAAVPAEFSVVADIWCSSPWVWLRHEACSFGLLSAPVEDPGSVAGVAHGGVHWEWRFLGAGRVVTRGSTEG